MNRRLPCVEHGRGLADPGEARHRPIAECRVELLGGQRDVVAGRGRCPRGGRRRRAVLEEADGPHEHAERKGVEVEAELARRIAVHRRHAVPRPLERIREIAGLGEHARRFEVLRDLVEGHGGASLEEGDDHEVEQLRRPLRCDVVDPWNGDAQAFTIPVLHRGHGAFRMGRGTQHVARSIGRSSGFFVILVVRGFGLGMGAQPTARPESSGRQQA
ncbi:hypothetical protein [Sorangium cellulosum]|uniref:hypothetical protein n=1 Tax=Sorangium cellulosum TaxID=56 RepID=UPI0012FF7A1B|nr:hypothetical protein [Sorangium cellulosum]